MRARPLVPLFITPPKLVGVFLCLRLIVIVKFLGIKLLNLEVTQELGSKYEAKEE